MAEVRDLIGVLQRESAAIGVYISLAEPTKPMLREAADAGSYTTHGTDGSRVPRVQLLTIEGLLKEEQRLEVPPHAYMTTHKRAPRFRPQQAANLRLNLDREA